MYRLIIFSLISLASVNTFALIPIEGILYGKVQDIKQYDPFIGMLNSSYVGLNEKEGENKASLTRYFALYKQGVSLVNYCAKSERAEYSDKAKEDTAIRSTVANLQYLGIDYTLRNIANYAKMLEFDKEKYTNLYTNLVNNSCSKNITVFSHKMLKANFLHFWDNSTGIKVPSIKDSPYFSQATKEKINSRAAVERSLYYTLNTFQNLCSWNSSTDDFALLTPYLRNPFLMSYVFSNMLQKKINIDVKTETVFFDKSENSIQVACENLICRRRTPANFKIMFPTINGSSNLEDDLKLLYCNYFERARSDKNNLSPQQQAWTQGKNANTKIIEAMNLVSQITGFSDILVGVERYSDVVDLFKANIKERWDEWAVKKSSEFNAKQLYEESLELNLISRTSTLDAELGDFKVDFNVELGEIDKLLGGHDKIDTSFNLEFPIAYIENLKQKITFNYNTSRYDKIESIRSLFTLKINHQLEQKKRYFKIPLWNDQMGEILANELINQFLNQTAKPAQRLSKKFVKIPVKFHFGVFALQYIRDKNKFRTQVENLVTLKQ